MQETEASIAEETTDNIAQERKEGRRSELKVHFSQ